MRYADGGIKNAEIIVNLGDGPNGGSGAARGRLLFDRNGGTQTVNRIDLGALHLIEELTRVGRQRFDIAPLALGVDGIEGEGRLPGAAQPRNHREGVPGNLDIDVSQVVLACAVNG